MKTINALVMALLIAFQVAAQSDRIVESKITDVTVFLSKAQVTRKVKTKIDAGKTNLVLKGLTSQIDQQSIQVSGKGAFIILGIMQQQNYLSELDPPKPLKILNDSLLHFQRQLNVEQRQKEILNKEEQMLLTNQKIGGANQNLTAAELKAMADFFRTRLGDILLAGVKGDEKIIMMQERMAKIQLQINELNEMYSRNTSEIIVTLSADEPTSVELNVNYIVANAGWYPQYDLRAVNTSSPLKLNYKAGVFQSTGELWNNVKLKLSTANPTLGGLKPELNAWYLNFYQPALLYESVAGKASGVAQPSIARDEDRRDKLELPVAETTANFVQAIQTSLNIVFDISLPYTVSSSNKPTVVDIQNYDMKADYLYAVAPKLDVDAFLLAQATGWGEFNLLPGEANIFFEGTFVGKTYIDPGSTKDTLDISLGRDKRVVVKREKVKELSSRKFIGMNQREHYAYQISVRNTKNEMMRIIVEDQIPVSQNSQIEITNIDQGGAKYNVETGKLTWELKLQPNETKKMLFKFDVKYPKDKEIAGL